MRIGQKLTELLKTKRQVKLEVKCFKIKVNTTKMPFKSFFSCADFFDTIIYHNLFKSYKFKNRIISGKKINFSHSAIAVRWC